jgi:Rhodopirellula transposase DDE domain
MGYRLRKVLKAKPRKKIKETGAIFANTKKRPGGEDSKEVKRMSIDCKATVNIGAFSRGGQTLGDRKASDHDLG